MILGWLLALVGMTLLVKAVGTAYSNDFNLPHTESTEALDLLQAAAPKQSGDNEQVVFETTGGAKVTDPAVKARIEACSQRIHGVPDVSSVVSPFDRAGSGSDQPGRDRRLRRRQLRPGSRAVLHRAVAGTS